MFLPSLISLLATIWVFPHILRIAKSKNITDAPGERKLQSAPVPVMGGIAVAFGTLVGMLLFSALASPANQLIDLSANHLIDLSSNHFIDSSLFISLLPITLASFIMMYVGSIDDIFGLSPRLRLFIETFVILCLIYGTGMCVDSFHGLFGIRTFSWWYAVPLTVFGGVGIINAYNMIDGVNGLSSGLCILSSFVMGSILFHRQDIPDATLAFCFGASLIPFLMHNVFGMKSKMFIGDGGTMVMGILITWFTIRLLSSQNVSPQFPHQPSCLHIHEPHLCQVAMLLSIASVPIFDTLRVMAGRILRHQSPFHPDKTHLHHTFLSAGFSHSITALSEIIINSLIIMFWHLTFRLGLSMELQFILTILISVILVWGTYSFLRYQQHQTHTFQRIAHFSIKTHLGHKHWWLALQNWLDRRCTPPTQSTNQLTD